MLNVCDEHLFVWHLKGKKTKKRHARTAHPRTLVRIGKKKGTHPQHAQSYREKTTTSKARQKRAIYSNSHFSELELLSLPNTSLQLQSESPAPQGSCKLLEQHHSGFGGAGDLPNTPLLSKSSYRESFAWKLFSVSFHFLTAFLFSPHFRESFSSAIFN
jgi:hypothetical protein